MRSIRSSSPTRHCCDSAERAGGISLVVWTLTIIVAIKYALLVLPATMTAGGVFALYVFCINTRASRHCSALVADAGRRVAAGRWHDHTAISVLSAVEGLGVAAPCSRAIVPLDSAVVDAVCHPGTDMAWRVFGPIYLWFAAIAVLGAVQIRCIHRSGGFNPGVRAQLLRQLSFYPTLLILGPWFWCDRRRTLYADWATLVRVRFGSAVRIGLSGPAAQLPGQGAYMLGGVPA